MNRFIKYTVVFAAILLCYFIVNYGINRFIIARTHPDIKSSTVIMGDSHIMTAIDPSKFENARNLSQTAEPYVITFQKLNEILKYNTIDTLYLGFSFHNISSFNDKKFKESFWADELFDRTYALGTLKDYSAFEVNYVSYFRAYLKNILLYPQAYHLKYLGSFDKRVKSLNREKQNPKSSIERHFYENGKESGTSQLSINYLDSIIYLAQKNDVYVTLVNTPLHEEYRALVPKAIRNTYMELSASLIKRVRVADYADYPFSDNYFADYDHLNYKGSAVFTEILASQSKKNQRDSIE